MMMVCVLSALALTATAQTKVIAHRGYWKTEGSAQNSIAALNKAAEAGVYGSEFDVQLTKDGVVVVNHDDSIQGKIICETPYADLAEIRLANGEQIPTLADYLKAGKELPNLQLILEIKPLPTKEAEDLAVKTAVEMVKEMQMEKQVEYISFSMNVCERLVEATPSSEIAYLGSKLSPAEIKAKGMSGIDYYFKAFEIHPEWVEQAHQLGMKVNVWTVNDPDMMKKMADLKVDFITTDQPVEAKELTTAGNE